MSLVESASTLQSPLWIVSRSMMTWRPPVAIEPIVITPPLVLAPSTTATALAGPHRAIGAPAVPRRVIVNGAYMPAAISKTSPGLAAVAAGLQPTERVDRGATATAGAGHDVAGGGARWHRWLTAGGDGERRLRAAAVGVGDRGADVVRRARRQQQGAGGEIVVGRFAARGYDHPATSQRDRAWPDRRVGRARAP
jgi:hypothetical protein